VVNETRSVSNSCFVTIKGKNRHGVTSWAWQQLSQRQNKCDNYKPKYSGSSGMNNECGEIGGIRTDNGNLSTNRKLHTNLPGIEPKPQK
jgi:hypothetical protein